MKDNLQALQPGETFNISPPYGRCIVDDKEKAQLVRSILSAKTKDHHLWYIGFGTQHSQTKLIKCFESKLPEHLLFPCEEIVQFGIKNELYEFFVVRTHLHGAPMNYDVEKQLVNDAQNCCRFGGMKMSDYIVLKPTMHVTHRLKEMYVHEWQKMG